MSTRKEIKISSVVHNAVFTYCCEQRITLKDFTEIALLERLKSLGQCVPVKTFEEIKK